MMLEWVTVIYENPAEKSGVAKERFENVANVFHKDWALDVRVVSGNDERVDQIHTFPVDKVVKVVEGPPIDDNNEHPSGMLQRIL